MVKLFTRTLRYRFTYLPASVKSRVVAFYRGSDPIDSMYSDSTLFEREIGPIVMQMVNVITERNKKGELWLSPPNTEARKLESAWSSENRLKRWVRNFDSNLLQCDDTTIIELILEHVLNRKPILEIENCRCHASWLSSLLYSYAWNEIVVLCRRNKA